MRVKLIEHTPEPERTVAMAARLCYSPIGAEQLVEKLSQPQIQNLLTRIITMGHLSTLEHVSFTFAVEGVSRVLTHQLVRHRIASYSQQSQRYVAEHDFEYIIPPMIEKDPVAKEKYMALMDQIRTVYGDLTERGIAAEDARYCLANATETKIVITMNARSLRHFFTLRCCQRAQWEIRQMAEMMLAEAKKAAPLLFAKAGPTCVTDNYCGEGELTCGRLAAQQKSSSQTR